MLSRRGARVVHGPTMATELLGDLDATIAATRRVLAGARRPRGAHDRHRRAVVVRRRRERRAWTTSCARALGRRDVVARGPEGPAGRPRRRARGRRGRRRRRPTTRCSPASASRRHRRAARRGAARRRRAAVRRRPRRARRRREVVDVPVYRWQLPDDRDAGAAPARRGGRRASSTPSRSRARTPSTTRSSCAPTRPRCVAAFDDDVLAVAVGPGHRRRAARRTASAGCVEPARARLGSMVHALVG